jgi:predicted transcriptional regulator
MPASLAERPSRRNYVVAVKLTEDEHTRLQRLADLRERPLAWIMRRLAFQNIERIERTTPTASTTAANVKG